MTPRNHRRVVVTVTNAASVGALALKLDIGIGVVRCGDVFGVLCAGEAVMSAVR